MSQLTIEFTEEDKANAESQADRVLRVLLNGPATSSELKPVTHRFSAAVKLLRLQGWVIDTVKLDQRECLHTLRGKVEMVKVTEEMQAAYYGTPHWQQKRRERREFDENRCCHCRSSHNLHVHHWVYDLFNEDLSDLTTLCETCHTSIHKNANIRIHFPRYVTPDIAMRLEPASTPPVGAST